MTRSTNTAKNNTSKTVAQSRVAPSIVLKTVYDAIMNDNPTSTLTTKAMRVKLRATPTMREIHVANASWIFTPSQSDAVRAMFDPAFAERIARASKRAARKPVAQTPEPVVAE